MGGTFVGAVPSVGARFGLTQQRLRWIRAVVLLPTLAGVGALFSNIVGSIDMAVVRTELVSTSPWALLAALVCTTASFIAIASYDVVAQRVSGLRLSPRQAFKSGFTASAIGQTTGFGMVVCTFVRWRMMRGFGIGPVQAAQMTAIVSGGFVLAGFGLLSVTLLFSPTELAAVTGLNEGAMRQFGALGVAVMAALFALAWWQPARLMVPPFHSMLVFVALTVADIIPAAIALWVLMPEGSGVTLAMLVPVFMTGLMLGLVTGAPGGVGVLEMSCLLAFAHIDPAAMVAALIMFRAVYFLVPFAIAAGVWAADEASARRAPGERRNRNRGADVLAPAGIGTVPAEAMPLVATAPRAEVGLARLGETSFLQSVNRRNAWMFARGGNTLTALSDPMGPRVGWPRMINRFEEEARARMLTPVAYRVGPEAAQALRASGWAVMQQGAEAVVDLTSFTLDGSARSGLRRKLRKATAGDITTYFVRRGHADLASLERISAHWLDAKGITERRFSLGRFDPTYLADLDMIVAYRGDQPVGFVSLWQSGDGSEWSVDLMRTYTNLPDGTMHALIAEAINAAQSAGAKRFSLCSVMMAGLDAPSNIYERVGRWIWMKRGAAKGWHGLYQFKNAFDPAWEPRYCATPHWSGAATVFRGLRKLIG